MAATGERLAVVETEIKALKADTGVIRTAIHGIHGEMQKFVQAEQRCVDALTQLLELKPKVENLVNDNNRKSAVWGSWAIVGSAFVGAVTIISGIVFVVMELLGRAPFRP